MIDGQSVRFHVLRSTFATWLDERGVSGDLIDRFMGHAGKSVRARHYTAPVLSAMLAAVFQIPLCAERCASRTNDAQENGSKQAEPDRNAPVAQWIEQRFPNASPPPPHKADDSAADRETRAIDALTNGPADDEPRTIWWSAQSPHKASRRALRQYHESLVRESRVGQLLEDGVRVALDRSLSPGEREEALRARLEKAAELVQRGR